MNRFEWKDSATVNGITSDGVRFYMLRIALLICSVLAAVYLSKLAMFDVWQNAFDRESVDPRRAGATRLVLRYSRSRGDRDGCRRCGLYDSTCKCRVPAMSSDVNPRRVQSRMDASR